MRFSLLLLLVLPLSGCFLLRPYQRPAQLTMEEGATDSAGLVLEALESDQDVLARNILQRMRAVHQDEGTLAWIEGIESVLEGRRLLQSLSLRLDVRIEEIEGSRVRTLVLVAETIEPIEFTLRMTPPVLRWQRSWIDSSGHGGSGEQRVGLEWFDSLTLSKSSHAEFPIMQLDSARGPIAAMREQWDLEMHYCYIEQNGRLYGVKAPLVEGYPRYLLASHLSLGELTPEPLVELLGAAKPPRIEQLIEHTVRIPEAQMGAALDQLTPLVLRFSPARIRLVAPALTWLAEGSGEVYFQPKDALRAALDIGQVRKLQVGSEMLAPSFLRTEPTAWKRWLSLRQANYGAKPKSTLVLPASLGDASSSTAP